LIDLLATIRGHKTKKRKGTIASDACMRRNHNYSNAATAITTTGTIFLLFLPPIARATTRTTTC